MPLGIFLVIVVFLGIGLGLNPRQVPSPLVDKPAPAFELAQLHATGRSFSPASMRGQVWLLNVWASWCVSCRAEHPVLVELAKTGEVPIYGLNYKDKREEALRWLEQWGDPYKLSIMDPRGQTGIDYGVYGVPETYVIDKSGVIRYKQIGPLTPEIVKEKIMPLVRKLNV